MTALLAGLILGAPGASAMEFLTRPDANRNSGLEVDVVVIYANDAIDPLSQMSADEWFSGKQDMMANYANAIDVVHLELPPGMREHVTWPGRASKMVAAYLFAHYQTPGDHRIEVAWDTGLVTFGADDIE